MVTIAYLHSLCHWKLGVRARGLYVGTNTMHILSLWVIIARFLPVHRGILKLVPGEANECHRPAGLLNFEIGAVLRKL